MLGQTDEQRLPGPGIALPCAQWGQQEQSRGVQIETDGSEGRGAGFGAPGSPRRIRRTVH